MLGEERVLSCLVTPMTMILTPLLASVVQAVPDSGSTGLLLGLGLVAVGLVARFIKNRRS